MYVRGTGGSDDTDSGSVNVRSGCGVSRSATQSRCSTTPNASGGGDGTSPSTALSS